LLWKFERPKFERLAAVAISVSPGHFDKVDPAPRPVKSRASKRHEQTTLGLQDVGLLLDAASNGPTERVATLLARFNQDAPDLDDFIDQLGVGTLEPLSPNEIANFTRLLHDKAKDGAGPVVAAAGKLLNITDAMPANMAAASYTGFMMSAYFADGSPAPRPTSPFIEDLFAWQGDLAMKRVLKVLGMRLHNLRSPALYVPDGKEQRLTLLVEHDAEQRQNPVLLRQIYVKQRAVLVDGEVRPDSQLRTLLGAGEATVREITRAVSRHYGLPFELLDIEGGDLDDPRFVPELLGLREFSRFDQDPVPEPMAVAPGENAAPEEQEEHEVEDDDLQFDLEEE
jgi:hypothetical protein